MLKTSAYDLENPQTWGVSDYALENIRSYQIEGVQFLSRPIEELRKTAGYNVRGCLMSDEMGLGKTVQTAISAQIMTPSDGTIVVACPPSVMRNWQREIYEWIGKDQAVHVVRNGGEQIPADARWVIMSFDVLKKQRANILERGAFTLIGDEGIRIKGASALRTQFFASLAQHVDVSRGCRVHILNGTPIANRISDLITPLQLIGHNVVENVEWFKQRYCSNGFNEQGRPKFDGARNVEELRQKLDGVFIQRLRKDVAKDLPQMSRRMIEVEPDRAAMREYTKRLNAEKSALRSGNDGQILAAITALKKLSAATKMTAAGSVLAQMLQSAADEKVAVFSFYPEMLEHLAREINAIQPGAAVVVHGAHSGDTRDRLIEGFKADPNARVFLGQIEATGVGANLTVANHVLFPDLDWRAYIHRQAEDRVNRLGQTRQVQSVYLYAPGTLDDHIIPRLITKQHDANAFERRQSEGNAFGDMRANTHGLSEQSQSGTLRALAKALTAPSRALASQHIVETPTQQ